MRMKRSDMGEAAEQDKNKQDILLELLRLHHDQMKARREKVLSLSRGVSAVNLSVAIAVVSVDRHLNPAAISIIMFALFLLSLGSIIKLSYDGRAYAEIGKVIAGLNEALELHVEGTYLEGRALYPDRWKGIGSVGSVSTVVHHWGLIALSCTASLAFIVSMSFLVAV